MAFFISHLCRIPLAVPLSFRFTMEGEQPPTKRAKKCTEPESDVNTEPNVESNVEPKADSPSEPAVVEGEQSATKRAKICDDPNSDSKTESNVERKADSPSEPVVEEERKRKIPTAKVDSPQKCESKDESKPGPSAASMASSPIDFQSTASTFLDLDDFCQTNILAELSLNDLGAMAEVCVKHKEIAQHFFAGNHRNCSLSSLVEAPGEKFTLLQARRLLYNFGHLITTLTINLDMLADRNSVGKLLTLISKYCVETLHEMVFENQPSSSLTGIGGIGGMTEYIGISMLGMELMMKVKFDEKILEQQKYSLISLSFHFSSFCLYRVHRQVNMALAAKRFSVAANQIKFRKCIK